MINDFPSNLICLSDKCAHCQCRIWYPDDYELSEKAYTAPKLFQQRFKEAMGRYNLGPYRLRRCEVCGKTMAVFFEPKSVFSGKVYVLYACTLLIEPKDTEVCDGRRNCYNCPVKGPGPGGL